MQHNQIVNKLALVSSILALDSENITNDKGIIVGKRLPLSKYGKAVSLIEKHRQHNPIVPGVADYIMGPIYDRVTYAPGATVPANFKWFVTPAGQSSKTKADTNLSQASTLTQPSWANVVGLGFKFSTLMQKPDIDAFVNNYYVEFYVDNKIYLEGQVDMFPAPAGITGLQSFATAITSTAYVNGTPRADNFFDVRIPGGIDLGGMVTDGNTGITINQGQTFRVECTGTSFVLAAANGTYGGFQVTAMLIGIISRSVQ